jgi:uncharacterized hydrophobic protein (TIGR00271 family)
MTSSRENAVGSSGDVGEGRREQFHAILSEDSGEHRARVLKSVREASAPSPVYWLMNGLATVIACYGLLANSPAVVIGAMVVAMLLNPLSGIALGLNDSDRKLLGLAFLTLVGGIAWILAIAVGLGFMHRDIPVTAEMLARTNPNLFDLIIALAGGAAGAVAVLSPRVGTAIVGVAVATALVPPLAAAGMLLARADYASAGGAFLLVLTNIAAIQLAFSVVFWADGYRWRKTTAEQSFTAFLRRNLLSIGIVVGLAAVLGFQMQKVIANSLFLSGVRAELRRHFDDNSGFYLVDVRFAQDAHDTTIRAVIRGINPPSPAEVAAAQAKLPQPPDGSTLNLRVRFIQIVVVTPQGQIVPDKDDPT